MYLYLYIHTHIDVDVDVDVNVLICMYVFRCIHTNMCVFLTFIYFVLLGAFDDGMDDATAMNMLH